MWPSSAQPYYSYIIAHAYLEWVCVCSTCNSVFVHICTFTWIHTLIVVQPIKSDMVVAKVQDTRKLSAFCHTRTKLHTELSKQSFLATWNIARSCLLQRSTGIWLLGPSPFCLFIPTCGKKTVTWMQDSSCHYKKSANPLATHSVEAWRDHNKSGTGNRKSELGAQSSF